MLRISIFKTPQPKQFRYVPRYWDQEKEERKQRLEDARRRVGLEEEPEVEEETGSRKPVLKERINFRDKTRIGSLRSAQSVRRKSQVRLIIILLTLLIIFWWLFEMANLFDLLIGAL